MRASHAKESGATSANEVRSDDGPGIAGRYFDQPSWWRRRRRKELRRTLPRHVVRELCEAMAGERQ
jgi:hypothetical protein